jgi:hypothetical protein
LQVVSQPEHELKASDKLPNPDQKSGANGKVSPINCYDYLMPSHFYLQLSSSITSVKLSV